MIDSFPSVTSPRLFAPRSADALLDVMCRLLQRAGVFAELRLLGRVRFGPEPDGEGLDPLRPAATRPQEPGRI